MRYWVSATVFVITVLLLMILTGCASQPLTEEQRMERFRLAAQLLTPPPSSMVNCTTTYNGNIAHTTCH